MIAPLALVGLIGCGTLPIPTVAVEGSTAVIMIPGAFPVGYGTALAADPAASPPPAYGSTGRPEDPQRGELVFELLDDQQTPFSPPRYLPLRHITKVTPRPEIPGMTSGFAPVFVEGQNVAILDVPLGSVTATGDYHVAVRRYRREDPSVGDPDLFENLPVLTTASQPFLGWGQGYVPGSFGHGTSPGPIKLRIVDSPDDVDRTTPPGGWSDFSGYPPLSWNDIDSAMDLVIPFPVAWVTTKQVSPPGPAPAAWQVDFTYPRHRIRIRTVTSHNTAPGAAIVTWDAGTDPATIDCSTPDQTLSIRVVDPNRLTRTVDVGFELENYTDTCGARAQAGDFQLVPGSFKGYDLDGVDTSATWSLLLNGDSPAFR